MNKFTENLLSKIGWEDNAFSGAFSIRENGACAAVQSTENIRIDKKDDGSGIEIHIKENTIDEAVFIPACITKSGVTDIVTNDFYVGECANVTIIAGCGVHSEEGEALHNGIHRFFVGKNAKVTYKEKHIGTGEATGKKINTQSEFVLAEGASAHIDSEQLGGVDDAFRDTVATVGKEAVFTVRERLLTNGDNHVDTNFTVYLNGENSKTDVVSRSVARGNSSQKYISRIEGNAASTGHTECDAILAENGKVDAAPCLSANCADAELIHEAAIGKIAGEQLLKLCSLGLTREQAEQKIIEGFLK